MIQKYIHIAVSAILVITALVIAQKAISTYLQNNAVDGCMHMAVIEKTDGSQVVKTPENYWYTFCMKEKGFK